MMNEGQASHSLPERSESDITPTEVRILPMSKEVQHDGFQTPMSAADMQNRYFLHRLPLEKKGRYRFITNGMRAVPGAVILFRYDGNIIASAVFLCREDRKERDEKTRTTYAGSLHFDVDSIKVFDPVNADVIKFAWPDFPGFMRGPQRLLPAKNYQNLVRILKNVRAFDPTGMEPSEEAAASNPYAPSDQDRRLSTRKSIRLRLGQPRFRKGLRKRYGDRCQVTGCPIMDAVAAAHISPYRGKNDHNLENGLLLRADIHLLFDQDLIGIHPDSLHIEVHPAISSHYGDLSGRQLCCDGAHRPSVAALKIKYRKFRARP